MQIKFKCALEAMLMKDHALKWNGYMVTVFFERKHILYQ
jgi:hypothetical protein